VPESTGVLLMTYGTPATLADVEAYYTHIRRGRPPEPAQLEELIGRYRAIGGSSPLLEISRAQQSGLQELLEAERNGRIHVELGMKHASPFIEDGVDTLIGAGVQRAVGLVLAPHYSSLSVGEYIARVTAAAGDRLPFAFVEDWHLEPSYIALLADRIQEAMSSFPTETHGDLDVVFTAHSLPSRILDSDDPYPRQLRETAEAVAESVGLTRWSTAWQSAGRTSEQWLGPDILGVVRELAAAGSAGVIVCPAGFVSDHLEILYDLDVECRALVQEVGLAYQRTRSPNADPAFLRVLADVALDRLNVSVP
jgi:protoporphyrin/coproporphyrin ferrochelatase